MTLRYIVKIGQHPATVVLSSGDGPFTGTIESPEFGTGSLAGSIAGGKLEATVDMDGHTASIKAQMDNTAIAGTLRCGWFYSEDFTGELVA